MTPTTSALALVPGALALVGVGLATGIFNAILIRILRLPSIIATLAHAQHPPGCVALAARPPGRDRSTSDAIERADDELELRAARVHRRHRARGRSATLWLYRTRTGMALRAVGLDETSSRRLGMRTGRTVILAFVACSVMASIAGFYLAAEVQIGSPIIGN